MLTLPGRGLALSRVLASASARLGEVASQIGAVDYAQRDALEHDWLVWLQTIVGRYVSDDAGAFTSFAPHHVAFWDWAWSITAARPCPFVAIWPRGHAKSTSAEMAAVALGARRLRRYVLYVCSTQERADDHVQNIGGMLESAHVASWYPDMAVRLLDKYGSSKGWRRNRLRTAAGFTVDAIGLDTAARGAKLDDQRPDWIILDDLDEQHDTGAATEKKIATITKAILPAGSNNAAVLAIQNLILADGVFAQLADGRADFLADRIVSGPHPALIDMEYVPRLDGTGHIITAGTPTWNGMDRAACQAILNNDGLSSFLAERQHELSARAGGMFDHLIYRRIAYAELPALIRKAVWVDPAVTDNDGSDSNGIIAGGIDRLGVVYWLWGWEQRAGPEATLERAILKAIEIGAQFVGVETNQGGLTWGVTYRSVLRTLLDDGRLVKGTPIPRYVEVKRTSRESKVSEGTKLLAAYEQGRIFHVYGAHDIIEAGLHRYPRTKPLDLVDAMTHDWTFLAAPAAIGGISQGAAPTIGR